MTERVRNLRFAAAALALGVCLSGGRLAPDAGPLRAGAARFVTLAPPEPDAVAAIRRDPFADAPGPDPRGAPAPAAGGASRDDAALVPDIAGPAPVPSALALRAVIAGPNPVAYVEDGTGLQIVRLGDLIGGRSVASIDLAGVRFTDGTRLDLAAAAPPAESQVFPAPPRDSGDRAIPGPKPRSRRPPGQTPALARPAARPALAPPADPGLATPPAAPGSAPPTPAPLRTVDARGLPPGANPTPDAAGPTAFPYPYPYAPPRAMPELEL